MIPPQVVDLPSVHRSTRGGHAIAAIVIHATAGTDSRNWLVRNPESVSAHALIARDGAIYRMVPDEQAAHHCGRSQIVLAGAVINRATNPSPNQITLGLELENLNDGRQPYPAAQLGALGWLLAGWSRAHPQARMLFHREIDTRGKTDPAGLTWPVVYAAMAPWLIPVPAPAISRYEATSPIVAPPRIPREPLATAMALRCHRSPYPTEVVRELARSVYDLCALVGVDPVVSVAQICHETGNLTSARCMPPQHNLAGIGATNDGAPGVTFAGLEAAARAQIGRLVAYAVPPGQRTAAQVALVDEALDARALPEACHGSAATLDQLGAAHNPASPCGWAFPGSAYGASLAAVATRLLELGGGL